ncbi:MAG: F0F1 ATP synthase subunit delta [Alicyclobacillaceae bacterium]|nr:F0F1 ATP synthase subunit delta [Alicyclobacillaceae bacterium]
MKDGGVAKRYANALFAAAEEKADPVAVEAELEQVLEWWRSNPEVPRFFAHPTVPRSVKKETAAKLFGDRVSKLMLNFLYVLLDHRREGYLPQIAAEYRRRVDEARGRIDARIESALPLAEEEIRQLADHLKRKTGKDVSVRVEVNPALIGGARVRVGDRVWDASLLGRLERFRGQLKQLQAR